MNTARRSWYQEPYVWMLVAIPLSSVLAGVAMFWLAATHEDGLVVDDYYKRGMEINRTLERDRVALDFGLAAHMRLIIETGRIHATLSAGTGFKYPPEIRLGLYHATRPGFDQDIALARSSDRGYSGVLPELIEGRWYLDLHGGQWRLTGVTHWPVESSSLILRPAPSDQ